MSHEPHCMKCDKPATHKITKIVKAEVHDIYLCDEHARSFTPHLQFQQPNQHKLVELLQHFLKQHQDAIQSGDAEETHGDLGTGIRCSNCGLTHADYRRTLLLGCSDCYAAFEESLIDDLRKIHGAISQHGAPPELEQESAPVATKEKTEIKIETLAPKPPEKPAPDPVETLEKAEKALMEAVGQEDFKEAARLRDIIQKSKKEIDQNADMEK